jgi:hypothetical protein
LLAQVDPLYSSVAPVVGEYPPNPKPAVCVPHPANFCLAVFKFPPGLQVDPLYSSVAAVVAGVSPPKANAAVCKPQPAK